MSNTKTYHDLKALRLDRPSRVLWLASWYPSATEPCNGDFIQRHAEAVARIIPLVVVHTIHDASSVAPLRYEVREEGMLTEVRVYFRHDGKIDSIGSRLTYNRLFFRHTKALLAHLFSTHPIPAAIHVHVPMKMGRLALWAKRQYGIPFFVSEQSSAYLPGVDDSYQNRSRYYRFFVRRILRKALGVSNVSLALGKILQGIAGRDDVVVIRNVADISRFRYQPLELPVFTFIHVSTMKEQKNVQGMLHAFEQLFIQGRNFHLRLVGGDEDILLRIRSHFPNASWLKLEGTVDHGLVAGHMQHADCLVMFSRDENFPCVIVEALCCGLPVVTSNAGGCAEAIHENNGLVVPSGDEMALLSALLRMMDHYGEYNRAGIATDAAANYSYEKIGLDFVEFYQKSGIQC